MTGCSLFRVVWVLILALGLSTCCVADIVLFHSKQREAAEEDAIRRAAAFYGVNLQIFDLDSQGAIGRAMSTLRRPGTLAVLTTQEALSRLNRTQLQAALRTPTGMGIPMLVFGVQAREDATELKFWSGGAIRECAPLNNGFRPSVLEVANRGKLTRTLSDSKLPAVTVPTCSMLFEPAPAIQPLLSVEGDGDRKSVALIRAQTNAAEVFFVPQMTSFDVSWIGKSDLPRAFSSMAPFILFLSYATGEYGWHLDRHYANLTVDDAWLTQPYGHLDYPALFVEMEKHNFHTTIAFIPWNFDRSEPDTVTLFRGHPERFSISVHGNDHNHREFGDYSINSLSAQIAAIKQGVARMEKFHVLTGIPYDRFMVFPHGIAPERTLEALKTYEFLGTANAENVPLGDPLPTDSEFSLRPYTVNYASFLSMSRYPAREPIPRLEIAIQSFLGNPLLFYGHESTFRKGIGAFNAFADQVNQVQPDTQWTSLGEIARNLHLVRRREGGGFDVWMLSNEMDLRNPTDREAVFFIKREERPPSPIRSMKVDGTFAAFERSGNEVALRLVIPARQVRKLRIEYQNDMDLSREVLRNGDVKAYALRRISDFRDLYLSRFSLGQALKDTYYGHGWNSTELYLEGKWWVGIICMALVLTGLRYCKRFRKRVADTPAKLMVEGPDCRAGLRK